MRGLPGLKRLPGFLCRLGVCFAEYPLALSDRNHDDPFLVGDDNVAGADRDTTTLHRLVERCNDILGAWNRHDPSGEDWKAHVSHLRDVADHAIDNERRDASTLSDRANVAARDGIVGVPGLNDDDRAAVRAVDGGMEHEIVARRAADRKRRPRDPRHRRPQRTNAAVHDLFATEDVGQRCRRNPLVLSDGVQVEALRR